MGGRRLPALELSDSERAELKALTLRRKTGQAVALRARIVLACAQGAENREVAAQLAVDKDTVGKWRRRFIERRIDGLLDAPRSGAPRTIEDARIEAVIVKTLESTPKDATHWSSRGMAKASGLSISSVQRIWRAFGLQPHRLETFKLSTDPRCAMSSVSISPRPSTPSCCALMRSRRSRPSTAASPCCRCGQASRRV
jgi:transposase